MKCASCGVHAGPWRRVCAACEPTIEPAAPEPRRGARDERLLPVVEIGPGTSLGLNVITFEVIRC